MTSKEKSRSRSRGDAAQARPIQQAPPAETRQQRDEIEWHERAAFHVSFYSAADETSQDVWETRVYHEEADGRAVWPGVASAALIDWMITRAALRDKETMHVPATGALDEAVAEEPEAAESKSEPPANLRIYIDDILVEEVPIEQQLGAQTVEQRIRAQVDLQLSGAAAYLATAHQHLYDVQILACDLATGQTSVVGTARQQLQPETLTYTANITFDLPPIGRYQIVGTVLIPDEEVVETVLGPVLTVTS
jgi:hypothetical protein